MEYVTLGNSDLRVSRLAFGCEPLGGTDWGHVDTAEVIRAVRRAFDAGITVFDTADVYGLGRSEELLATALGPHRKEVAIATKFGVAWTHDAEGGRARTFRDASPATVVRCLEASLRRLKVEQIALYQLHWPDPATPIDATAEALQRCVEAGKVRFVGACNLSAEDAAAMHAVAPLTSLQLPFSLIDAGKSVVALAFCRGQRVGTLAYGCLAQGMLTGKYRPGDDFSVDDRRSRLPHFRYDTFQRHQATIESVTTIGRALDKTTAQTAIRWVLDSGVDVAIVGAKHEDQLAENLGALGWYLPPELQQVLGSGVPVDGISE